MKRFIALILTLILLTGLQAYAEQEQAPTAFTLAGFDPTQYRSWSDNAFFDSMEELTGLKAGVTQYTDAAKWSAFKASAAKDDPDLPDALFMANLTQAECADMLSSGVLIDLKPYLEECCPNFMEVIARHPGYMEAITLPDGTVPALPYINETPMQNGMWINRKFLSRVRMEVPDNREELETVLRAFKAADCNGNGRAEDEKPLGFLGPFDLKFLAHAFGLVANDYNIAVSDGTVRFLPAEDEFREFILWCREMFAEGLFDKDGFSTYDSAREVTDAKKDQIYGILIAPMVTSLMPVEWQADYELMMPLEADGQRIYRDFGAGLIRGTFAVTSHCADVASVLRWVDALYGEEGAVLASIGKKNRDYLVDGDGTWRLTESSRSNSYYTVTNVITSVSAYPGYSADSFQRRYGEVDTKPMMDALAALNEYCVLPFPYCSLTKEEHETVTALQSRLGPAVDIAIGKWVTGEEELTPESFDAFKAALKEAGMDEFVAFWQRVYDARVTE